MSASTAALTAPSSVPNLVEAELLLRTLGGADNPLAYGGRLERITPDQDLKANSITSGQTAVNAAAAVLPKLLPSGVTYRLYAPVGSRLLELVLEIVDYSSSEDRVEIQVSSLGISTAVASTLTIDAARYTWRLSGMASLVSGVLKLTFELVQELVPTQYVDAAASTQFPLTCPTNAPRMAVIKVRPSGVGIEA